WGSGARAGGGKNQTQAAAPNRVAAAGESHALPGRAREGQRGILAWSLDCDRRRGSVDGQLAAHVGRYVVEREGRARRARSARSQQDSVGGLRGGQGVGAEEPGARAEESRLRPVGAAADP